MFFSWPDVLARDPGLCQEAEVAQCQGQDLEQELAGLSLCCK